VPSLQALHLGVIKVVTKLPDDSRFLPRIREHCETIKNALAALQAQGV
jgi:hypothetical protein